MSEELRIIAIVGMAVIAVLFAWLSLMMAALESAVSRVTRANLNNLMIETQTDGELTPFTRAKKIKRIHTVQQLIVHRYPTASACAFFRISSNVLIGAIVVCIMSLLHYPFWAQFVSGVGVALIMAVVSVLMRPRTAGSSKPLEIMLRHATLASVATHLTPFICKRDADDLQHHRRASELSDDEELEKIQLEQGKAAIDRLVESNRFDPEVSQMLRNVLMLSDTLTREIMVPRTDMICIEQGDTLESFLRLCSRLSLIHI